MLHMWFNRLLLRAMVWHIVKHFPPWRLGCEGGGGGGGRTPLHTHKPEILPFKFHDVFVWNVRCLLFLRSPKGLSKRRGPPTNNHPVRVIIMLNCGWGLFYSHISSYSAVIHINYKAKTKNYRSPIMKLEAHTFIWTSNILISGLLTGWASLRYWTSNRKIRLI